MRGTRHLALLLPITLLAVACRPPSPALLPVEQPRTAESGLRALLVNGGGRPADNFHSHLVHIRDLVGLLRAAGVPTEDLWILNADGSSPEPDLAVREQEPEDEFWLLFGTRLARRLRAPLRFVSSSVDGMSLKPATEENVAGWFETADDRLGQGETLLLYVTDHGTRDKEEEEGPEGSRITLWDGSLSVAELDAYLERIPRRTRVVLLMSQCYSGGFATLGSSPAQDGRNVCGFFSTTAERLAYGCYPEDRGQDGVGHDFAFFRALERSGSFPDAHEETLVTDRTPDVPLATSDVFLERLLERVAKPAGDSTASFADRLLDEARRGARTREDEPAEERSDQLLLRMSEAFGEPLPRSLREIDERIGRLRRSIEALGVYAKAWEAALGDANRASLDRFLHERPEWKARLDGEDPDVVSTRADLLPELAAFSEEQPKKHERILALGKGRHDARALRYRMEVLEAALLRMRTRLLTIAGEAYLSASGSTAEREAYDGLRSCESLQLGGPVEAPAPDLPPFPSAEEDRALLETVRTPRIGIDHDPADPEEFSEGAAVVQSVAPGSPAERAGLRVGDVILGPPGDPFTERNELRGWLKLVPIGEPVSLEVDRKEERIIVTVEPEDAAASRGRPESRRAPPRS